ncbi:uncharacterized protein LOC122534662 [Frieseomelitta varia]|nr:uncharacterized protein LOC122534662 [Frieseomelitta varia]
MKIILVAFCLVLTIIASRADFIDMYLEFSKDATLDCGKENGFTEDDARAIFDKDLEVGLENATCLKACILKQLGMLRNSKINMKMIKDFIRIVHKEDPETMKIGLEHADYCHEKVKDLTDDCKMAYGLIDCYLEKGSALMSA